MSTQDTDTRVSVLESKVQSINASVEKLEDKIDSNYTTLHTRISDLRDDLRKDISVSGEKIMSAMDDNRKSSSEQHKVLADKIQGIEKWRWMIMGAAMVFGYVLAHIKLGNLLSS